MLSLSSVNHQTNPQQLPILKMPSLEAREETQAHPTTLNQPLVVILGPTAVGKTELSIHLAERFNGEIVSADSRLIYRGMNIGTAKPTWDEQKRVPHHLIDIANPNESWSLALYQKQAHIAIDEIQSRGKIPFLVGGTGQYIQAIAGGWRIPHVSPDPHLRFVLEEWSTQITPAGLHSRLAVLDPEAASTIDARNIRRTIRALEVIFTTGQRFSDLKQQGPPPYTILQLGLTRPREELYERVDQRIEFMIQSGFVEEVAQLIRAGYSSDLPSMTAIGYYEISMFLLNKISLDEAISLIKRRTRTFIRRQANWFKLNDPNITWVRVTNKSLDELSTKVNSWLSSIM